MSTTRFGDDRPAVWAEMCNDCIFRPGNLMQLRPGRLKDVVQSNLATGSLLICHQTTHGQADEEVVCRGFFDRYGDQVNVKRVMDRIAAMHGLPSGFRTIHKCDNEEGVSK